MQLILHPLRVYLLLHRIYLVIQGYCLRYLMDLSSILSIIEAGTELCLLLKHVLQLLDLGVHVHRESVVGAFVHPYLRDGIDGLEVSVLQLISFVQQ